MRVGLSGVYITVICRLGSYYGCWPVDRLSHIAQGGISELQDKKGHCVKN